MYSQYISPFGYKIGANGIDSYGVNHQGFDIRDEIEYQFAREKRESELMEQYKSLGITDNFPQYGTNFWSTTDNNYGFGISNIADNIANMKHTTTPIPVATAVPQSSSILQPVTQQNPLQQVVGAVKDMMRNYVDMKQDNTIGADDYFHCKANYEAAKRGKIGENVAERLGNVKEEFDFWDNQIRKGLTAAEAYQDEVHDKGINLIGRQRAKNGVYKNSKEACYSYRVDSINEKY